MNTRQLGHCTYEAIIYRYTRLYYKKESLSLKFYKNKTSLALSTKKGYKYAAHNLNGPAVIDRYCEELPASAHYAINGKVYGKKEYQELTKNKLKVLIKYKENKEAIAIWKLIIDSSVNIDKDALQLTQYEDDQLLTFKQVFEYYDVICNHYNVKK